MKAKFLVFLAMACFLALSGCAQPNSDDEGGGSKGTTSFLPNVSI
jgi:hypothetical protein